MPDITYTASMKTVDRCIQHDETTTKLCSVNREKDLICLKFRAYSDGILFMRSEIIGDTQKVERALFREVSTAMDRPLEGYTKEEIERTNTNVYGQGGEE